MAYTPHIHILLADDDPDDNMLFHEAMAELPFVTQLTVINNGELLLQYLNRAAGDLPNILFLDLNMPRKNGFDCLAEIKNDEHLKKLAVIIITTASEIEIIEHLYLNGANYYIRKPNSYDELKLVIHKAIIFAQVPGVSQPPFEDFVLSAQTPINVHE